MNLHVPTMFLMLITASITLTLVISAVAERRRKDGLFLLAVAMACHAFTYIAFALRGRISDLVSIVLANAVLAVAIALLTEGVYQFQQRPPPRWPIWLPVPAIGLGFLFILDNQLARVVGGSSVFALQCIPAQLALYRGRHTTVGRGQHYLAAGFALMFAMFVFRALGTALSAEAPRTLTAANPVQAVTFLVALVGIILIALGFVLMTKERADERNRLLAMQDELTGLGSRRAVLDALDRQLALAVRSGTPLTVLMIDLDHFKQVNDRHGHLAGDEVLRQTARRIAERLRAHDMAGRWGGEEFLIVLPHTTAEGGRLLAEDIRRAAARPVTAHAGCVIPVTLSIGVHAYAGGQHPRSDTLIAAADVALYRAKTEGRDRVVVAALGAHSGTDSAADHVAVAAEPAGEAVVEPAADPATESAAESVPAATPAAAP